MFVCVRSVLACVRLCSRWASECHRPHVRVGLAEASRPRVALSSADFDSRMTETAVVTKAACDALPLQCCVSEVKIKT